MTEQNNPVGRPRDPALEATILRATVDVLVDKGLAGMTVEAVARAAGTGKAGIYRRWATRTELVIAAVRSLQREVSVPDTGSLRDDLVACARHYATGDRRVAVLLADLISESARDEVLRRAAFESLGKPPADAMRSVFDRWVERGQIASDAPIELVAGIIPAAAYRQMALRRERLGVETVTAFVDQVILPALAVRS